jgi:DNA repair exonuclease SbcCD ATPase subunit
MQKKLEIGQKARVEIQWNVLPMNYSPAKADEIKSKVATKYGISKKNVVVNANFIRKNANGETEVATAEIVQNIQDPRFQQNLFKRYLDENGVTDYDFDRILAIDNQINSLIDYEVYDKFRRYKIEWVRWSNFLSYGENNYIDFSDLTGLVLLKSEPANQGGKTNFACDLIEFLLFGSVDSGKASVLKKIFNKHLPEATDVVVEGGLEIDGEHYVIKRTLTRPQKKRRTEKSVVTQKVEYYRVVDGTEIALEDSENLEGENNVKTNQIIKEALGNKKDFKLVVSANADNLKELVSMKETERGKLLSRWIGLMPLEEKNVKAREKWNKEIAPSLLTGKYDKSALLESIKLWEEGIQERENLITNTLNKITSLDAEIKKYTEEKDELLTLKQFVDMSIANLDITTLNRQMEDIVNLGQTINAQIAVIDEELKELGDITFSDDDYHGLVEKRDELVNKIAKIKADIGVLRRENEKLTKAEYCPTCGQKLIGVDNTSIIRNNEEEINKLINEGIKNDSHLKEITTKLTEIENTRKAYQRKSTLELKKASLSLTLSEKRNEYTNLRNKLNELNRCKEAIESNNKIDTRVNVLNVTISTNDRIKSNHIAENEGYKREILQMKKQISEYQIIIGKLEDEEKIIAAWRHYLMLVGKDGISKMVLGEALPLINNELQVLLSDVCDFDVVVEMDAKNEVTFSIIADGVMSDLSSGSGFEQTVAALALRCALGKISTMSRPSFMLLDEVLGGVAKDNYENVKKLYDRMLKEYSFIFQVTHLEDIADWHDTTVVVKKEDRISSISVLK